MLLAKTKSYFLIDIWRIRGDIYTPQKTQIVLICRLPGCNSKIAMVAPSTVDSRSNVRDLVKFVIRVNCCYSHYIIIKEKAA